MAELLMVFCYDIEGNRARRKVAELLEERCVRVQRSVFEVRLERTAARRLAERAAHELGPGDSLRVYAITEHGLTHSMAFGPLPLPENQDFWLL